MHALLAALVFAGLTYNAIVWLDRGAAVRDGRLAVLRAECLRIALSAAAALVGGILVVHRAPFETLPALAIVCAALGATCYLATFRLPVSAVVPGTALAVVVAAALLAGDYGAAVSAAAVGAPFAVTAVFTRTQAPDMRDAAVAALGGAAFGLQLGLELAGLACLATLSVRFFTLHARPAPASARFSAALAATFLAVLLAKVAIS